MTFGRGGLVHAWSEDEDAALKEMHARGLSCSQIASELAQRGFPSRSRNSVIGRTNRLGLVAVPRYAKTRSERISGSAPANVDKSRTARAGRQSEAFTGGTVENIRRARAGVVKASKPLIAAPAPVAPVAPTIAGWPKPITPTAVRFLDRRYVECAMVLDERKPIETRMVCGAEVVPGKAWCLACFKVVFQQVAGRGAA